MTRGKDLNYRVSVTDDASSSLQEIESEAREAEETLSDLAKREHKVELQLQSKNALADLNKFRRQIVKAREAGDLDRVEINIEARDEATRKLDAVNAELRRVHGDDAVVHVDADTDGATRKLDEIGDMLGDLPGMAGDIGGALGGALGPTSAVAGGAALMYQMATATADAAVEADNLANLTGASVEAASRLNEVWKQGSPEADAKDLQDVLLQMQGVLTDDAELAAQLGINLDDGRDITERFLQVIDLLDAKFNDVDRAVVASRLFGEEGVRQVNALTGQVGDLGEALDGIPDARVFDSDSVDTARDFHQAMAEVKTELAGLAGTLSADTIPQMTEMLGLAQELASLGQLEMPWADMSALEAVDLATPLGQAMAVRDALDGTKLSLTGLGSTYDEVRTKLDGMGGSTAQVVEELRQLAESPDDLAALGTDAQTVTADIDRLEAKLTSYRETLAGIIDEMLGTGDATEDAADELDAYTDGTLDAARAANKAADGTAAYRRAVEEHEQAEQDRADAVAGATAEIQASQDAYREELDKSASASEDYYNSLNGAFSGVANAFQRFDDDALSSVDALNGAIESKGAAAEEYLTNIATIAAQTSPEFAEWLGSLGPEASGMVEELAGSEEKIAETFGNWTENAESMSLDVAAAIGEVSPEVAAKLATLPSDLSPTWDTIRGELLLDATAAGAEIPAGMAAGIEANIGTATGAVEQAALDMVNAAKSGLEIKSPSRVMAEEVGQPIAEGVAEGIREKADDIADAMLETLADIEAEAVKKAERAARTIAAKFGSAFDKIDARRDLADITADIAEAEDELSAAEAAARSRSSLKQQVRDAEKELVEAQRLRDEIDDGDLDAEVNAANAKLRQVMQAGGSTLDAHAAQRAVAEAEARRDARAAEIEAQREAADRRVDAAADVVGVLQGRYDEAADLAGQVDELRRALEDANFELFEFQAEQAFKRNGRFTSDVDAFELGRKAGLDPGQVSDVVDALRLNREAAQDVIHATNAQNSITPGEQAQIDAINQLRADLAAGNGARFETTIQMLQPSEDAFRAWVQMFERWQRESEGAR